jgi:hypothetical protein
MRIYGRKDEPIKSLKDWEKFGKPASSSHWSCGRSAYELAAHWIERDAEAQVVALLQTRSELSAVLLNKGVA